jgi:molecular chaperone GrpE
MGEDEKPQAKNSPKDSPDSAANDPSADAANDAAQAPAAVPPEDSAVPEFQAVDEPALPSMEDRVRELTAALVEAQDQALRQRAEAENIRRRFERERADTLKYAASGLAKDLLNVADNLYRALKAVPDAMREGDEAVKNFLIGVEMTEKELISAFQKHGIRRIMPIGETFSHKEHQAMFEVENTGKPAGTVVELMQPGYIMHERLLRPAMVGVAKGDPEPVEHIDTTV